MHPLVLASQLWQYYQHQQQLHEQLQQLQQLTAAMVQGYLNNCWFFLNNYWFICSQLVYFAVNAMSTFALAPPATPSPATPELPSYHQQMAGIVNQNSFTNRECLNFHSFFIWKLIVRLFICFIFSCYNELVRTANAISGSCDHWTARVTNQQHRKRGWSYCPPLSIPLLDLHSLSPC